MSSIDGYRYEILGFVTCPIVHNVLGAFADIPIYRLLEDISAKETELDGKKGDILLGGGSGQSAAFRIAIPEAFYFLTHTHGDDLFEYKSHEQIYKAFWTPTQAYVFGVGYTQRGWSPGTVPIEWWLAHHILQFLTNHYRDDYKQYLGTLSLEQDGTLCRMPTREELEMAKPDSTA